MPATLETLRRARCSAILRTQHADAVAPAMQAAVDGGFRVVEFTLNTPNALQHIETFAGDEHLLVGAGTVLSTDDARAARDAGARFLVSPVVDEAVIDYAVQHDLVAIPGCATPTEMLRAHRSGAQIIKLFPSPADGPATVQSILGPMPFLRIFPTSGVTLENVTAYFAAGAFGVGFVTSLFAAGDVAAGRFDAIRERAAAMTAAVAGAP